jgi:hypothetical protein
MLHLFRIYLCIRMNRSFPKVLSLVLAGTCFLLSCTAGVSPDFRTGVDAGSSICHPVFRPAVLPSGLYSLNEMEVETDLPDHDQDDLPVFLWSMDPEGFVPAPFKSLGGSGRRACDRQCLASLLIRICVLRI